jgi:hypothetical protein
VSIVVVAIIVVAVLVVVHAASGRPGSQPSASGISQRLAVPAYVDPAIDPETWAELTGSGSGAVGIVVVNVDSGPGTEAVPAWASAIRSAHKAGSTVLGYVDSGYLGSPTSGRSGGLPTRSGSTGLKAWLSQIRVDIADWYRFYGSDLGGIFFDETSGACGPTATSTAYADQYRALSEVVKRLYPGAMTVLNPGVPVGECFRDAADVLVTFEGSYQAYTGSAPPGDNYRPLEWSPADSGKIWHIVYGATSEDQLRHALALSKERKAGYVYVTGAVPPDPFDSLPSPSYWKLEQRVSAAPGDRAG